MTRPRLGAIAAGLVLAGGALGHALDEEGLLPGVRENAGIREYADHGAPRVAFLLLGIALATAVGYAVARSARARRTVPLLLLVSGGQAAYFASYEVAARAHAGLDVAEMFAEPAFVTGFAVQCLVAAAFVTLVVVTGRTVLALLATPRASASPRHPNVTTPRRSRAGTRRAEAPPRGRAPPYRNAA